jgi:hypothetical protein
MSEIIKIQKNWEIFEKLCSKLSDPGIDKMLETLGERLVLCSFSTRTSSPGCRPGGLVEYLLETTMMMKKLNIESILGESLSDSKILKVGLLHEVGKVGDLTSNLFVEQESDWHRDKLGEYYKYNEECRKMSTSHRTLFLLQHFGVNLSADEWLAIQLAQGIHIDENRFYVGSEPVISTLLRHARDHVMRQLK